jgi:hypothetical protein
VPLSTERLEELPTLQPYLKERSAQEEQSRRNKYYYNVALNQAGVNQQTFETFYFTPAEGPRMQKLPTTEMEFAEFMDYRKNQQAGSNLNIFSSILCCESSWMRRFLTFAFFLLVSCCVRRCDRRNVGLFGCQSKSGPKCKK